MKKILKWTFLVIFLLCAIYIAAYFINTGYTMQKTEELSRPAAQYRAKAPSEAPPAVPASTPAANESSGESVPDEQPAAESPEATPLPDPLLMYYQSLAEKNPDMVGWIFIDGTTIDFPVMYTPNDPEFYLHRDFDKGYAFEGVPFLDGHCDIELPSDNAIIYGHNMRNGGMFAPLHKFRQGDFLFEHQYVEFDWLHERGTYKIFAVMIVTLDDMGTEPMLCYSTELTQSEEHIDTLRAYVQKYAAKYDLDALPNVGGKVVTLSTCTGFSHATRLVVMAAKVGPDGEPLPAMTPVPFAEEDFEE